MKTNGHTHTGTVRAESPKDPRTLEREIEATRSEIRAIVQALEHKLSPGELFDRAMGYVRGNGRDFAHNLGSTVKANPVPAVLASVGLLWLMAGDRHRPMRQGTYAGTRTGDVKEGAAHLRDEIAGTLHDARERIDASTRRAGDTMHGAADRMRTRAHDAREGFEDLMTQQPLAVGAIGIAVGALFGALLPRTQSEDRLLGEASDDARERAAEATGETLERADERLAQRHRGDGAERAGAAGLGAP